MSPKPLLRRAQNAPRSRKVAGGALVAVLIMGVISAFTLAQAGPTAVNMFGSQVPTHVSDSDTNAVELGTKFTVNRDGRINGVRFYKSAQNTGLHVGNVWNSAGRLLATAKFVNETASGWQYAAFATPLLVAPNNTYVVSYHTNGGHYSGDQYYYSGKGAGKYAIQAPADGVKGSNGVYKYGATSAFPDSTYRATNYWVDANFTRLTDAEKAKLTTTTTTAQPATTVTTKASTTTTAAPATTTSTTKAPATTTTTTSPTSGGVPCALNQAAKACWASHTGVPGWTEAQIVAGQSPLVHTVGNITVTTPGTVIDGRWIDGCIAVKASNVTIKNTLVRTTNACFGGDGTAAGSAINNGGGQVSGVSTNLQIIDSEVDAGQTDDSYDYIGVGAANFSLLRVNVHGTTHTTWVGNHVTIRDSFIHDPSAATLTRHNETIDMDSGDNNVLDHNWVSAWNGNSAAGSTGGLFNGGSWGAPHDNVITNNFFEGGNGTDMVVATAAYNTTVAGNRLSPHTAYGNLYTYSYQGNAGNSWSDNRDSESGVVINP